LIILLYFGISNVSTALAARESDLNLAFALTICSYFEGLIHPISEVDDVMNVTETAHARVTEAAEKVHSHN
jgi:hypothetical protein